MKKVGAIMKHLKHKFTIVLAGIMVLFFTSCNKIYKEPDDTGTVSFGELASRSDTDDLDNILTSEGEKTPADLFLEEHFPSDGAMQLLNFRAPVEGEEIAVIKTSMGDIKVMLFPEIAPKAVENFKALIRNGYYNTTGRGQMLFHRVKKDFVIQSGDPTGTGAGGQSSFGTPFEDEFSEQALHFRGALSMANSGANTNQSQFFIVQASASTITQESWEIFRLQETVQKAFPETIMQKYQEVGGAPWLDFSHTVFGQVIEGLDVVDAIAAVPVSDDKFNKPLEDVIIQSMFLESYSIPVQTTE